MGLTMPFKKASLANFLGLTSLSLTIVPLTYIAYPEVYPDASLTEAIVLLGGIACSFLAALAAGFLGSRWWFVAILGSILVLCLLAFSP